MSKHIYDRKTKLSFDANKAHRKTWANKPFDRIKDGIDKNEQSVKDRYEDWAKYDRYEVLC